MQSVASFLVVSPFLAVHLSAQKERFVTIPVGAVIETAFDLQEPGLVTATVNGDSLLIFLRDIMDRTEPLQERRLSVGA